MTKKTVKVIAAVLMAIVLVVALTQGAFATKASDIDADMIYNNASDTTGTAQSMQNIVGSIITVAQVIGVGVAVIMLIVLAIKYISAAPGDKAEIKKHAVVYVVGAIVLFAATGILGLVKNFANMVKPS